MINGDHREGSLAERLAPGWIIEFTRLRRAASEHFIWQDQQAFIDHRVHDPEQAKLHAACHVALGHERGVGETFTAEQEAWANTLVDVLLCDSEDWIEAS